jgi:hypothetical protein
VGGAELTIYDKDELRAYQTRMEEAAKRDHRKLGAELDLFSFPEEIGSGRAQFGGQFDAAFSPLALVRHAQCVNHVLTLWAPPTRVSTRESPGFDARD